MTQPMTSVVPQVIDWLVAAALASPNLGANPTAPVTVYDGLQSFPGSQETRVLWVGGDPAAPGDPIAEASQTLAAGTQARKFDEDGAIAMTAQYWSGSTVNKVNRDGAAAIVAGVELLLRGLARTGGPGDAEMGGLVYQSFVSGPYDWRQSQRSDGGSCLVTFHIVYLARLITAGS